MDNNGENNNRPAERIRRRVANLLRAPDFLPRNEILGGYVFICSVDSMRDFLRRRLFGMTDVYIDSVRAIRPGLTLFLYNYETRDLHGIFEAESFGGVDIDPTAWPDSENPGRSLLPAQVRIRERTPCRPMDRQTYGRLIHHCGDPNNNDRIRVELTMREAINLIYLFWVITFPTR